VQLFIFVCYPFVDIAGAAFSNQRQFFLPCFLIAFEIDGGIPVMISVVTSSAMP
jgi:hypothetical protein